MEKELGRRFYSEEELDPLEPTRFEVVMGSKVVISEGGTPWLEPAVESLDEVKSFIEKMERIDVKKVITPELLKAKEDYEKATGKKLKMGAYDKRTCYNCNKFVRYNKSLYTFDG